MPLAGKYILIVEDEYFIAADLARGLRERGAQVVGPVGDVDRALALLEANSPDGAVLDVNLGGPDSFPIADRLEQRGVPYVFLPGYDSWALPERYQGAPRLAKPFNLDAVLQCLEQMFAG